VRRWRKSGALIRLSSQIRTQQRHRVFVIADNARKSIVSHVLPRRGSKTRSVRPCGASARNSGINPYGVLARTHVFDGPETILQRSNGDQEIVAARTQINRIVRERKVSGNACVQNVNGAGEVVDQNPDLRRLSRHNVTPGTEVSLMFHFHSLRESLRRARPWPARKMPQ
jgi:hypothetical protein